MTEIPEKSSIVVISHHNPPIHHLLWWPTCEPRVSWCARYRRERHGHSGRRVLLMTSVSPSSRGLRAACQLDLARTIQPASRTHANVNLVADAQGAGIYPH